ncbi:hemin-degrading factor [Martelella alba]|uniref:Hemin-degrading factor n=1 Tax=Martelella alba TaxID=2590451 RepID=A0A506UFE4_9HYPH|nr:ChuX/HutX family heme-like substrate-binding protein [Martelella alba]TPW30537.1 hemin-degrading factor [Martelella alba]
MQDPNASPRPTPDQIRAFRAENPTMRERDAATRLGICEAALVAAEVGLTATRLIADPARLLARAEAFGEVMALSRNDSAVHEKIGVFENIRSGARASIVLGENIDLRIFPNRWAYGFAVTKTDKDGHEKLSLQYFDKSGTAIFKLHMRPGSNLEAYRSFVAETRLDDQSRNFTGEDVTPHDSAFERRPDAVDVEVLRGRWAAMTDTHQFFGMLSDMKLHRQTALESVGEDFAEELAETAVTDMFKSAATQPDLPIMAFVANSGIVQIHSGPVSNIVEMGPWINVMDPTFHLHLRRDHIARTFLVRKPTADGHVTSIEAFDAAGDMIIQFFGKRQEGFAERPAWRDLAEALPRLKATAAA